MPIAAYPSGGGWIGEAQGAFLDEENLLLQGGFIPPNFLAVASTHIYNARTNAYTEYDDFPKWKGITHSGFTVDSNGLFYMCGGTSKRGKLYLNE